MVKSDHLRVQTIRSIRLRILTGISEVRQYFKAKMVQAAERAFCGDHSLQTTALMPRRTSKPGCRVSICGSLSKWQLCRCFFECFSEKVQYTHCVCVYSFLSLLQCQPDQPVGLICHKQRNVQHIIIQLEVIQRKADTQLYFICWSYWFRI